MFTDDIVSPIKFSVPVCFNACSLVVFSECFQIVKSCRMCNILGTPSASFLVFFECWMCYLIHKFLHDFEKCLFSFSYRSSFLLLGNYATLSLGEPCENCGVPVLSGSFSSCSRILEPVYSLWRLFCHSANVFANIGDCAFFSMSDNACW